MWLSLSHNSNPSANFPRRTRSNAFQLQRPTSNPSLLSSRLLSLLRSPFLHRVVVILEPEQSPLALSIDSRTRSHSRCRHSITTTDITRLAHGQEAKHNKRFQYLLGDSAAGAVAIWNPHRDSLAGLDWTGSLDCLFFTLERHCRPLIGIRTRCCLYAVTTGEGGLSSKSEASGRARYCISAYAAVKARDPGFVTIDKSRIAARQLRLAAEPRRHGIIHVRQPAIDTRSVQTRGVDHSALALRIRHFSTTKLTSFSRSA